MTDEELDAIERKQALVVQVGLGPITMLGRELIEDIPALIAEVRRLRAAFSAVERMMGDAIKEWLGPEFFAEVTKKHLKPGE
jgi:hypothetical protein